MHIHPLILTFLIAFILYSCQPSTESGKSPDSLKASNDSNNNSSIRYSNKSTTDIRIQEKDTFFMRPFRTFGAEIKSITIRDSVPLYSQLGKEGKILTLLPMFTEVQILEKGGAYTNVIKIDSTVSPPLRTVDIKLNVPVFMIAAKGDTGYVSASDICYNHIKNPNGKFHYFISLDEAIGDSLIVYKFDLSQNRYLDTFGFNIGGSDSEVLPDKVSFMSNCALKNVDGILDIYRVDEYCGGGQFSVYIVDANDTLSFFNRVESGGELCEGGGTSLYMPFIKTKDTINGIQNLNERGLQNAITSILKEKKISVYEIIGKRHEAYSGVYDENDEPIMNKDGSCKQIVFLNKTEIYYWNGYQLVLLKTVDHLK